MQRVEKVFIRKAVSWRCSFKAILKSFGKFTGKQLFQKKCEKNNIPIQNQNITSSILKKGETSMVTK